jgi:endo-1,4-beta-xylanase
VRTMPIHSCVLVVSLVALGCSDKGTSAGSGGDGNANVGGGAASGGATNTSAGTTSAEPTGGAPGSGSSPTSGGSPSSGGAAAAGATSTDPDCSATMPTSGGTTKTGTNVYGNINGLNYGIWTNGSGGSITVFSNAHAFSTSWSESQDFLAHLGLDFNPPKAYTAYGTITAQFVEKKSGTAGGFSMIGMYGWMHSPCVEWYINEDSWNGLYGGNGVTATIDGATYTLRTVQTTGTGGANACESGHTGTWTQMISTRKTARQCGTITVSDHFAAWEKQGWTLGTLTSVHINVEVGGGTGSIDFPVANVTTTSK